MFREIILDPLSYEFMQRGLFSAFLLSLSGGLLGCILVLRRLSLMGDALSHSLLPGIAVTSAIFGTGTLSLFFGALLAGLLTAVAAALLNHLTRLKEDAAFGSLFVIFFALGIAIISTLGSRIDLLQFLFGNILGVSSEDLRFTAIITSATLVLLFLFRRSILLETFDPVFLKAIGGHTGLVHLGILSLIVLNLVAALQTMGVILALGLFLLPAITAILWCERLPMILLLSVVLAVFGSTGGILLSYHLGIASGPSIVLTLGSLFLLSTFISNKNGLLPQLIGKFRQGKILHRTND